MDDGSSGGTDIGNVFKNIAAAEMPNFSRPAPYIYKTEYFFLCGVVLF